MTASLDWTIPMPEDTGHEHPPIPLKWWETIAAPLLVLAVAAMAGSGAMLWRDAPGTGAQISANASDIVAVKAEQAAMQRSLLALESDARSTRERTQQMQEALSEIKAYNGATMKSINELNVQFAEIRGSIGKGKVNK